MDLHFRALGQGDPLIILHGLFGSGDNWQTVAQRLAAHFHVFVLDLRNHGRSPHAPQMDYPILAQDVAEFLVAQRLSSAHLLGHSLGGKIAMQLALCQPARVRKLVVVDVAPHGYPPWHRPMLAAMESIDPATLQNRHQADSRLAQSIPDRVVRQFLLKSLARSNQGQFEWRLNLAALSANYDKLNGPIPATGSFTGPVLFMRGQQSDYLRDADWPQILGLFPNAREEIIPNAGHWVHAEAPDAFISSVSQFLKSE